MSLYNYTEDDKEISIFMEYCNDPRYFEEQLTEKHKEIKDETELKKYVRDILIGLKYIHDLNIIHTDMKPHNILIHREDG